MIRNWLDGYWLVYYFRRRRRASSRISSSRFNLSCSTFWSFSFSALLSALSANCKLQVILWKWWAVMNESCRWSGRDLQCLFSAACIFRFNRSCGVRVDAYDNKRNIQTWLTHLLSLYLFLRLSFKSASGRRAGCIAPFYLPPLGSYRLNTWQLN